MARLSGESEVNDHQSHEDVAACLSPEGPALVVALWLRAVFELARWDRAAGLCTPELRLAVAQAFVHRGLEAGVLPRDCSSGMAEALAAGTPPRLNGRCSNARC
jgi:hypothetical protein